MGISDQRITHMNEKAIGEGQYVLYWMQQSQRAHDNPALELAIREANKLRLPVLVAFALTEGFPDANRRHYRFMLEGLAETAQALAKRRIRMVIRLGEPPDVILGLAARAALAICDVDYTRIQRKWRRLVAAAAKCRMIAVEGDVVVPVKVVSDKAEYAARTIRPKINRHVDRFLTASPRYRPRIGSLDLGVRGLDPEPIDDVLDALNIDHGVTGVTRFFKGGPRVAKRRLRSFIRQRLDSYDVHRNQPQTDDISHMSPYLHFGQISPVFLAMAIRDTTHGLGIDRAAYLEELIVRRELAINFVYYTRDYDAYTCLPNWVRKTLSEHTGDRRPYVYGRAALESGATHDPYWNAAMAEMRCTGFMHNYMRMYWGKKILQWSSSPERAFETALAINNKYFLDGRDPNSYAGVGWVFGLHDRAWSEREILGKVRYMAASGLERKCDIKAYVKKVNALCKLADKQPNHARKTK